MEDVTRSVCFNIYRGPDVLYADAFSPASTLSPRSFARTFVASFLAAATTAAHRASSPFPATARSSFARDDAGEASSQREMSSRHARVSVRRISRLERAAEEALAPRVRRALVKVVRPVVLHDDARLRKEEVHRLRRREKAEPARELVLGRVRDPRAPQKRPDAPLRARDVGVGARAARALRAPRRSGGGDQARPHRGEALREQLDDVVGLC